MMKVFQLKVSKYILNQRCLRRGHKEEEAEAESGLGGAGASISSLARYLLSTYRMFAALLSEALLQVPSEYSNATHQLQVLSGSAHGARQRHVSRYPSRASAVALVTARRKTWAWAISGELRSSGGFWYAATWVQPVSIALEHSYGRHEPRQTLLRAP